MASTRSPWKLAGIFALASLLPYAVTPLSGYRLVSGRQLWRILEAPFSGKPAVRLWEPRLELAEPGPPVVRAPGQAQPAAGPKAPAVAASAGLPVPAGEVLEDPAHALRSFHEALARAAAGEGVVRICHFGDSPVTGDLISGEARARFQQLHGNAGHGWILPGRPWEWYGHLGVTLEDEGWTIRTPMTEWRKDRAYGFAGAAFSSRGGARTRIRTSKNSPFDQLEIHYLAQPGGGALEIDVDGEASRLETRREEAGPAVEALELSEDTPHTITLKALGNGDVTLYGVVMERSSHGVVYDALGENGGAIHHMALMDGPNWAASLRLRKPDLVILAFGTNESGYANIPGPGYAQDYREIVRRIREALPGVSILFMAPMDREERGPDGLATLASIPKIVEAQRKLALELGCAFFNTYAAMGGEGSGARWYQASPRLMTGDLTHPTRTGADRVAKLLVEALEVPEPPKAASN
jgi:hypothetical protein